MFPLFNKVCLPANIISHGPVHAICKRNHPNENDIVARREEERDLYKKVQTHVSERIGYTSGKIFTSDVI